MIIINQLSLDLDQDPSVLREKIAHRLRLDPNQFSYKILRESLDARRRETPRFVYQVQVQADISQKKLNKLKDRNIIWKEEPPKPKLAHGTRPLDAPPIVVGAGPAGLFCAWKLAREGYAPLLLEQGQPVEVRARQVDRFWTDGSLDPLSNVQFGEGGAGTFSDGKLTSRSKDPRGREVLEIFAAAGAPQEITYQALPHIGTDLLRQVIVNIRHQIEAAGGRVAFGVRVERLLLSDGVLRGVVTNQGVMESPVVLLAPGHSARPLFETLLDQGVAMENKPFAMGLRIEHPQDMINACQYHGFGSHARLGPASYRLSWHDDASGRGIYTFCMCPGGRVVAAASEEGRMVVNGMSYHARDLENANSALLATVTAADYGSGILDSMYFQRKIEEACFQLGGGGYMAPVQTVGGFLRGQVDPLGAVEPSVKPGYRLTDLSGLYPAGLTDALRRGIVGMGGKLAGFDRPDAVLTGAETRSSSPVRILRQKDSLQSENVAGLYPLGEGAGYAGGIISSAIDGLRGAEAVIGAWAPAKE
jgi:uncharacterized FAD-dependent dehydrogenase